MKSVEAESLKDIGLGMDQFWRRKDLILLAPGSLPCIRELYLRAKAQGALSRFRYVRMRNEDYILGTAEDRIRTAVKKAAAKPGAAVIVIYLSCLDILIRLDFEDLEHSLSEETGCKVLCFFRGPLAKTDEAVHPSAEELLGTLPPEETAVEENITQLPPPMADTAGVSDALRFGGWANVLLTPAGCRSCMRDGDMTKEQHHVFYSAPAKADYVFGWEGTAAKDIGEAATDSTYDGVMLVGSAVPSFLGFDEGAVGDALKKQGKEFFHIPTDGFHDAIVGVSQAEMLLVKQGVLQKREGREVWILGYSELLCGDIGQYAPYLSFLTSRGLTVRFVGRDVLHGTPALSWVVSAAGLSAGRWLSETCHVPCLTAVPVGAHASAMWKRNVEALLKEGRGTRELVIHNPNIPRRFNDRVLFVGDPVIMMGAAHAFWHEGFANLMIASYGWTKETLGVYRSAPGAETMRFVLSKEDLKPLWEEADLVVCDPSLLPIMGERPFLPLPWGFLSGRSAVGPGSGVLGSQFQRKWKTFLQSAGGYRNE